ncbi:MAG TPA: pilus assembly PilX N-terminal domain-containing protein [Cellvibrionaceae bacterium]
MKLINLQQGAALVVSLVILAVVTLIGVAAMQNSSLELKLVASTKDRATAFQAAEAALALYEKTLEDTPPQLAYLSNDCNDRVADKSKCFVDCANSAAQKKGFCFQGTYINGQGKASCSLANRTPLDPVSEIHNDNAISQTTGILAKQDDKESPVKILVEFLCFVEKPNISNNSARASSEENSASNSIEALNAQLAPLFRLTAVAEGDAKRSHIVVQTTFRLAE